MAQKDSGLERSLEELLLRMLERAKVAGYRTRNGACYERFNGTRYWRPAVSIAAFVASVQGDATEPLPLPLQPQLQLRNRSMAEYYLAQCDVTRLRPDSAWHAFRNGLLHVPTRTVHVDADVVACAWHDADLPDDLSTLPTPLLDAMLSQPDDAREWTYALLGRLLLRGAHDAWAVAPCFSSDAILEVVRAFVDGGEIETLPPVTSPAFLRGPRLSSRVWVSSDASPTPPPPPSALDDDWTAWRAPHERDDWTTRIPAWRALGVLTGSGSASRHVVTIPIAAPTEGAAFEMPHVLLKCAAAYAAKAAAHGRDDIWDVLPPWFHAQRPPAP
jgi:hypothetical protein